ncbi:hypothetical protein H1P_3700003 [Hyella patelloides LEGE 07179]|uniref:Uncharacterized protein n=1 Tax=Hyella patelloides LEGE 07179 TaxID=945734 RepID=A0A563VWI9_9CYAN|nr:hypothetical protein H1P_3700003 [Hyella patelloides LEGE 07179]
MQIFLLYKLWSGSTFEKALFYRGKCKKVMLQRLLKHLFD